MNWSDQFPKKGETTSSKGPSGGGIKVVEAENDFPILHPNFIRIGSAHAVERSGDRADCLHPQITGHRGRRRATPRAEVHRARIGEHRPEQHPVAVVDAARVVDRQPSDCRKGLAGPVDGRIGYTIGGCIGCRVGGVVG